MLQYDRYILGCPALYFNMWGVLILIAIPWNKLKQIRVELNFNKITTNSYSGPFKVNNSPRDKNPGIDKVIQFHKLDIDDMAGEGGLAKVLIKIYQNKPGSKLKLVNKVVPVISYYSITT